MSWPNFWAKLLRQSLLTRCFSPLVSKVSQKQKEEEVVVCPPGAWEFHGCPDLSDQRSSQPTQTLSLGESWGTRCWVPRGLPLTHPGGSSGLLFYCFFLASFWGLLFSEGAVGLGSLITPTPLDLCGSASSHRATPLPQTSMYHCFQSSAWVNPLNMHDNYIT